MLTVDDVTGEVTSYVSKNVPRTTETVADLVAKYPATVGKVKQIVDAALASAKVIGNVKVGNISADISRAYDGTTEDRGSESPLGDLVANALRDKLPTKFGKPDIGVTNPGGLRTDLAFKGNTTDNPDNTDGVGDLRRGRRCPAVLQRHLDRVADGGAVQGGPRAAVAARGLLASVPGPRPVRQRADDPRPDAARRIAGDVGAWSTARRSIPLRRTRSRRSRSWPPVATTSRPSRRAPPR